MSIFGYIWRPATKQNTLENFKSGQQKKCLPNLWLLCYQSMMWSKTNDTIQQNNTNSYSLPYGNSYMSSKGWFGKKETKRKWYQEKGRQTMTFQHPAQDNSLPMVAFNQPDLNTLRCHWCRGRITHDHYLIFKLKAMWTWIYPIFYEHIKKEGNAYFKLSHKYLILESNVVELRDIVMNDETYTID